jgi:hypothetical protein
MHLEIIAGMQETHDKAISANEQAIEELTAKLDTLTERTIQAMESINTLGRIDANDERLDSLE